MIDMAFLVRLSEQRERNGPRAVALTVQLPVNFRFTGIPKRNSGERNGPRAVALAVQLPVNLRFTAIPTRN